MQPVRRPHAQVLAAIAAGLLLGVISPAWGVAMRPLGDAFVALLRMLLAPIIFCTVVHGLAGVHDLRSLGRLGVRSLIYFEVVSSVGLLVGWGLVNVFQPGAGLHVPAAAAPIAGTAEATDAATRFTAVNFLLSIIPRTLVGAFAGGEILQVLFVSVLVGVALRVSVPRDSIILRVVGWRRLGRSGRSRRRSAPTPPRRCSACCAWWRCSTPAACCLSCSCSA
jgi:aerobic C4-dicarboxylate transport protein